MVEEDEVLGTPAPNPSSLTWNRFTDFDLFAVRNLTMTPHPPANQEWNEQLTAWSAQAITPGSAMNLTHV